ncbi:hypothetical protein SDC9_140806 [bioreactor metagenome]|uniref:Uncharacterized protein n=1 Tax=bioreactor metagenome TaxID=1076179 RepID=A0A645DWF3_9ZZZZ
MFNVSELISNEPAALVGIIATGCLPTPADNILLFVWACKKLVLLNRDIEITKINNAIACSKLIFNAFINCNILKKSYVLFKIKN